MSAVRRAVRRWLPCSLRRQRAVATVAALLVFTNGPVLLFSKRALGRTGRWEDAAVWPFLAVAALASAALAAVAVRRGAALWKGIPAGGDSGQAVAAPGLSMPAVVVVTFFSLTALISALWSVNGGHTLWRASVYVGMALLAVAVAKLASSDRCYVLASVASIAVVGSLLLLLLRPDIAVDANGDWHGLYTNRNSLAPLASLGVITGLRLLLSGGSSNGSPDSWRFRDRAARIFGCALAVLSLVAMIGAGSRTAWIALSAGMCSAAVPVVYLRLRRTGRNNFLAVAGAAVAVTAAVTAAAAAAVALWDVSTMAQRRAIWGLVWDRIVQRPIVGHGFFAFWEEAELTSAHELLGRGSAHNSLLETGLGLGLLGMVPFVAITFLAAWNSGRDLWRHPSADTWMWAAVVGFLLVENLTESFVLWFSYNWVLLMAAALRSPEPQTAAWRISRSAGMRARPRRPDARADTAAEDHGRISDAHAEGAA